MLPSEDRVISCSLALLWSVCKQKDTPRYMRPFQAGMELLRACMCSRAKVASDSGNRVETKTDLRPNGARPWNGATRAARRLNSATRPLRPCRGHHPCRRELCVPLPSLLRLKTNEEVPSSSPHRGEKKLQRFATGSFELYEFNNFFRYNY